MRLILCWVVFFWTSLDVTAVPDWTCTVDGCCSQQRAGCGDCDEVIDEFGQAQCDCGTCEPDVCQEYLTEDGNDLFSASSYTLGMEAYHARLGSEEDELEDFGWQPDDNDTLPWLQIDLLRKHYISGLVTRGNPFEAEFVSAYKVLVSPDNTLWNRVDGLDNDNGIFIGNSDGNSSAVNYFDSPVHVRSLRVYPLTWQSQIILRLDLLGCLTMPTVTSTNKPTDDHDVNISIYLIGGICFTLFLALVMVLCLIFTPRHQPVTNTIDQDIPKELMSTPNGSIASSPTSASSGDTSFRNHAFTTSQKSLIPRVGGRHKCDSNPFVQVSFPKTQH